MKLTDQEQNAIQNNEGFTMHEWNLKGRIVKNGQKGQKKHGKTIFYLSQTIKAQKSAEFFLKKSKDGERFKKRFKSIDHKAAPGEKMQLRLFKEGGTYINTVSKKWLYGCRFSNNNSIEVFLLFRKGGVDIKAFSSSEKCFEKSVFDLEDGKSKFWMHENKYSFNKGAGCSLDFKNDSNYSVYAIVHKLIDVFQGVNKAEEVERIVSLLKDKCLFKGVKAGSIQPN